MTFGERFTRVFAQAAVGALVLGAVDAAVTLSEQESLAPAVAVSAAFAIVGFDGALGLAAGAFVAAVLALVAPDLAGDPRAAVARWLRSLWPRGAGERAAAGAALLVWGAAAGGFVAATYAVALAVIHSMRTPGFAAAAIALLALPIATVAAWVARHLAGRAASAARGVAGLGHVLSPAAALCVVGLGVVAALVVKRDAVEAILSATNLGPLWTAGVGLAAALLPSLAPPLSAWPGAFRVAAVSGAPAASLAAFVLVLSFVGHDNATRLVLTTHGQVSPTAYKAFKRLLDVDGDGRLSVMGEGDCAAFDSDRYAGAPEVPNNGRDEDCDGEDLDLSFPDRRPRWDHPVPPEAEGRRNVVLLTVDAIAPSHMSMYGYFRETSPFLDELARSSVWFRFAYSEGPSTRLAIPAMWTSRYDSQIETAVGSRIPLEILPSNLTMAEVLRGAGYRTVAVVPTPFFRDWKGFAQGFDVVNTEAVDDYVAPVWHNGDKVTDAALSELAKAGSQQPLFLWVHWFDPHGPYTQPPGGPDFGTSESDLYDAEIAYTDREMRRFVEGLFRTLPRERTILIVSGDHGETFDPAHPKRHHGYDLHSSVLHLPLLVSAPFLKPRAVDTHVSTMDLLPTLVNLLKIPGSFGFEGTSLVPELSGAEPDEQRLVFHQFYLNENVYHKKRTLQHVGVRAWSLYLIHDLTNNTHQLYRYRTDPWETENLYEEMPEAAAMLKSEIARFVARVAPQP